MSTKHALLILFIFAAGSVAMAASSGEGHGHGLDDHAKKTIMWQTLNVTVMFALLYKYLKNPIKQMFAEKKVVYMAAAEKAEAARRQAEEEHAEIEVRLTKLESTADESVSRARAEAADMKKGLLVEAANISKKIRDEAQIMAQLEIAKAKATLRQQLVGEAIALAQSNIKSKVSTEDHKRLQGDFIHNMQAGQQ